MGWISPTTPSDMSATLDVMGFSHNDGGSIDRFHKAVPSQPLVSTECCSCETQRGEDQDLKPAWPASVYYGNENSGCVASQTQTSNGVPYNGGTFVWTMQ